MDNGEPTLAEESQKIQKLRDKLKLQIDLTEQRVLERSLKNKVITPKNLSSTGLSLNSVVK